MARVMANIDTKMNAEAFVLAANTGRYNEMVELRTSRNHDSKS